MVLYYNAMHSDDNATLWQMLAETLDLVSRGPTDFAPESDYWDL